MHTSTSYTLIKLKVFYRNQAPHLCRNTSPSVNIGAVFWKAGGALVEVEGVTVGVVEGAHTQLM